MGSVLVTGASGFIGTMLAASLEGAGHRVIRLSSADGAIDDPATLRRFEGTGVSRVFHLAGKTYVPDSWSDPVAFCRVNALGVANALEFCRAAGIPVTYVSAYLYGQPDALPIREDAPVRPNNPYALSKFLGEKVCEFYASVHRLPVTVIRPFNIYGPGQALHFLVPTILHQALHDDTISVQDLRPKRDYVFVEDLVEALLLTMDRAEGYDVYNVGSGASLSVREIIDTIQSIAGTSKRVVSAEVRRMHEIDDVVADTSRARSRLNWRPRHSFEQGIRKMLQTAGRSA